MPAAGSRSTCPTPPARAGRTHGRRPGWPPACASSTTTPTSWWWTSRPASRRTRAPAGTDPTVVGALAAAGYRVSTSGAAERQGVVHRLDVGTSGLMVVAKSERAYSVLKQAFRDRDRRQALPRARAGPPGPEHRHRSTPRSTGTRPCDYKWAVVAGGQPERHALRDDRGGPGRQPAGGTAGDRAHPSDPRAHGRAPAPVRGRPDLRRRPGARRAGSACRVSGCTPSARLRPPGGRPLGRVHVRVPGRPRRVPGPPARLTRPVDLEQIHALDGVSPVCRSRSTTRGSGRPGVPRRRVGWEVARQR